MEDSSPSPDGTLDIAELARLGGVSTRTIRYYGERGLLRAAGRGPGGRRVYAADALERLRFINRLKRLGLTLEDIGALNRAFDRGETPALLAELEGLLLEHMESVHTRIEELRALHGELGDYLARIRRKREDGSPTAPEAEAARRTS